MASAYTSTSTRSQRSTTSILDALYLHRETTSVSPPIPPVISYVSEEEWVEEITHILSEPFHTGRLSRREHSLLEIVMNNGMEYNPGAVLGYLFRNWEGIINHLISHGLHTKERYQSLVSRIYRTIRILKDSLIESDEMTLDEIQGTTETTSEITHYLRILGGVLTNISRLDSTLNGLLETRCVSKTPLCLRALDVSAEYPSEGITLQNSWPEFFPNECPDDTSSLDDRKVFVGSWVQDPLRWNAYRVNAVKHHAQMSIPSGWVFDSSTMNVNRPGYYPRSLGLKRCRIGLLLAALDSIATQVFISYEEYANWTHLIRNEIRVAAGPPPAPPTPAAPPMPTINGEDMTITESVAEDDIDPVTLEPFKKGDRVIKMNCCRNKILTDSIQGILNSGRTPKCPLCRTMLLV